MNKQRRLIIFAREPKLGKGKTRFFQHISKENTLKLYGAFTHDVLEQARLCKTESKAIYYTGSRDIPFLGSFAEQFDLVRQHGGNLGERMLNAQKKSAIEQFEKTVIIGTDCLSITPKHITEAFESLSKHDLVLGPSRDGGYYLIGVRKPYPKLFEHIPWGSDTVLMDTLNKSKALGLSVHLLKEEEDMDTWPTLVSFMEHTPDIDKHFPETTHVYQSIQEVLRCP